MPVMKVSEIVADLLKMPQDAELYVSQADDERAYRCGGPFLTTDGDVILSVGAIFIEGWEEDEPATEALIPYE